MEKLIEFSQKSETEILTELKTSQEGLNEKEAEKRLRKFGLNKISSFKIDLLEIIKRNCLNFLNIFLFIAGLLSFLIKGPEVETNLIFFFLILSILIAIFQDYRVNKLSEKLLSYFKNYAWVKRDGKWQEIEAEYLVPGDYVKVQAGYLIPADIRILKTEDALVDESIITGESEPIYKNAELSELIQNLQKNSASSASVLRSSVIPENISLLGTTLIKGEIEGIVLVTGKESYFGSIAKKTIEISKETAYEKMMDQFAKNISFLAILIALIIISINLLKPGYPNFQELIIFSIVLAVAIVPEFLPTMTVLALSLAGNRLAKKGLVIKRLSSIEDLGAIQILCTDKTGTITTNELRLERIITQTGNEQQTDKAEIINMNTMTEHSALSPDKSMFIKYFLADYYFTQEATPYDKAILEKIKEMSDYSNWELIEDTDFDPIKRIRKIIVKVNDGIIEIVKGSPEEIAKITQDDNCLEIFKREDKNGLRTLALAVNNKFLGIASFVDPLKESAFSAINLAKRLNLEIKILTGDSLNVARAVGLKLGLIEENERVVLGEEIRNLTGEELKKIVKETKIFARVLPEDKLKIIEVLQKEKFVGFLGEGINDAPALKIVNVALAVDTATDIVKQEADIILKEKDLKTIIDGIYQGRKVLENIGKYIKHTMSDNFGNLTSVAILTSILPFVPMTPLQVLLTNFLTDIPLIAFANDNVEIKEIKKPVKMSSYHLILLLLGLGIIAGTINILGYLIVKNQSIEIIQTYIFFLTTITGLIVSFLIRTKNWFFLSKPSKSFIIASIIGLISTIVFIFLPSFNKIFGFSSLNQKLIFTSLVLILAFILGTEIVKKVFYKKFPDVI
ncbi:MAG: magnesium-translocating P-type ATPase [Candidatus Parcubacteria bacterium]|nr:MAG: magnesium-translocating P-type ATPase [Candidatus Parcubacteria bacterium]